MATTTKTAKTRTASELAAEKLAEARALTVRREAEAEAAEENAAGLVARLERGDDSVSALDLVTAEAEVRRIGYLIAAARRLVPLAERELDRASAIDNPTLARWLAERIEGDAFAFGLFGLPVNLTSETPAEPGVYLVQDGATKTDGATGIMSGRVRLVVITPNRARLDGAAILAGLAAIEREGVALVQGHANRSPYGCTVIVDIRNLKPELPTLPEQVDPERVKDLARDIAGAIAAKGGQYKHDTGNPLYDLTVARITWGLGESSVTKQDRDGDQMHRTIRAEIDLSTRHFRPDQLAEYIDSTVSGLAGEFVAGVGKVNAARVASRKVDVEDYKPGREYSNRPRKLDVRIVVEAEAVAKVNG